MQAAFTYNSRLQLASLRYSYSSTDLLNLAYNYGTQNNGQIASIQYFNGASEDTSRSVNFTYDAWSRLKIANTTDLTDAGTRNEGTWKLQWDYDRFGNRVNQDLIGGVGFSAYQPQLTISSTTNRITDAGYLYDLSGNMTAEPQHAYAYDAENRMTAVDSTAAKYVYDANGLRVRKTFNGTDTYYVFSGTKVIAEYDVVGGQTSAIREYVYSGSQLVATLASDGQGANTTTTYHHPDHLSVRVNTDGGGSKIGEQAHLPFGDLWYSFDSTSKWRFTSYERDPESDNDYAISRSYVNRLGRFSSPDPLPGNVADPQSLNRYAYVRNQPVDLIDTYGLEDPLVCMTNGGSAEECFGGLGWGEHGPPLGPRGRPHVCGSDSSGEPLPCPPMFSWVNTPEHAAEVYCFFLGTCQYRAPFGEPRPPREPDPCEGFVPPVTAPVGTPFESVDAVHHVPHRRGRLSCTRRDARSSAI